WGRFFGAGSATEAGGAAGRESRVARSPAGRRDRQAARRMERILGGQGVSPAGRGAGGRFSLSGSQTQPHKATNQKALEARCRWTGWPRHLTLHPGEAAEGEPMTEAEWLECTEVRKLLFYLRGSGRASDRRLRLFAVSCCRRLWHLLADDPIRRAIV